MRRWMVIGCVLLWAGGAFAADGEALFKSNRCGMCHKADKKATGPSVAKIAEAYAGKKAELEKYLAGKGEAVVEPEKSSKMDKNLEKTKAMSDEERTALASYLLGGK
jgi:cytochrome c